MTGKPERPGANPEVPRPAHAVQLAEEILQPGITEKLLNAQLAEALFLMRDSGHLYRISELPMHERQYFVEQSINLMRASGELAARIGKLGGDAAPAETRFRYIVERVDGKPATPQGGRLYT